MHVSKYLIVLCANYLKNIESVEKIMYQAQGRITNNLMIIIIRWAKKQRLLISMHV